MKLFFRNFGDGQPLLALHGLFGLSDNWVTLGKQFGKKFRVLIPDLRNHGRSPYHPVFDFPSMEEDILELIEEEADGPVLLLGHSLGGRLAVNLALHHPRKITKLVIVDISLRINPPGREHLDLIEAMQQIDFTRASKRSDVEKQLQQHVSSVKLRRLLQKNVHWRGRGQLAWRLNLPVISRNIAALFAERIPGGIYPGPALFLRGDRSGYLLDSDLPAIYKQFPGATVSTVQGAGHWVHADNPGEFYRVVSEFLGS